MKHALISVLAWGCLAAILAGCANRHVDAVNAAKTRWLTMRTAQMLALAHQQFEMGDLDQSEATVREALAQDGASPPLLILAGRIALERGRLERSYHYFEQARSGDPNIPVAHYYQAVVFERWSQHEAALESYRRAHALEADNVAYLLAIGETLVALDRVDEALETLRDKLTYFEQNAGIREAIGRLLLVQGDVHGAVDAFQQAALLNPEDLQIAEELALARLEAGQHDEAIRILARVRKDVDPARRHYLDMALVTAYQRAGRLADARAICRGLTRSYPEDPQLWLRRAELAWAAGDLGEALVSAGRVRQLTPEDDAGYLFAGMVWHQRGDAARAAPLFERARRIDADNAEPAILHGMSLEASGRSEAAAEAYREALRRRPDDDRARRLLARVEAH